MSLVAGRPCPQKISFPLSVVAPDPHLRLIGCCLASSPLASSLDPHLPIHPPFCSFVWSSPASTRFPPLRLFFRRSLFHIARGRFLDQFRSRVPHHRSGPPQLLRLHSYGSYFRSCDLTFRPLLVLFSPLPTYPVWSGHALVHSFYYHRVSPVLSLSVTLASSVLVLKHIVV